jgi:hypothetical protein
VLDEHDSSERRTLQALWKVRPLAGPTRVRIFGRTVEGGNPGALLASVRLHVSEILSSATRTAYALYCSDSVNLNGPTLLLGPRECGTRLLTWPPFGSRGSAVRHVRELGDIDTLKSYLLLVWSEWALFYHGGSTEAEVSIKEDFGVVGMWFHRDDLNRHLDYVQGQLDRGLGHFQKHEPWIN